MMTFEQCMRAAFQALLRGDTAGRDHFCAMAENILAVRDRLDTGYPPEEAIITSAPILLTDRSKEKLS